MLTDKSRRQDKDSGIFLLGVIFYKSSRGKIRKMSRAKRELIPGYSYHITIRCNNREFRLTRLECRQVLLYAIKKAIEKYGFKLYALCVMSNHIHYLIEPKDAEDLPKIMHWLNWYTAMCFNRMLNRTGHFWEKRYHSSGFPTTDTKRALNTLRYIHANPKAAGVQVGFFYDFSDYGVYDRLGDDGLTTWHPAFLSLGETLEECAAKYRGFCKKYRPRPKPETRNHWGSKLLAGIKPKKRSKKSSPGQLSLWEEWEEVTPEILAVADQFVFANAYNPRVAGDILQSCRGPDGGPRYRKPRTRMASWKTNLIQFLKIGCYLYMLHFTSLDAKEENTLTPTPPIYKPKPTH